MRRIEPGTGRGGASRVKPPQGTGTMAKIRHIAIKSDDPIKLAQFYEDTMDMKVILRRPTGAIYMTDGYMNVALLPVRDGGKPGIDHFGFEVDSIDDVAGRLKEHGHPAPKIRPNNPPYAEQRAVDPDGNYFDLSEHGFQDEEYQEDRAARGDSGGKVKEPV
jgi:catechol 2,3-dioxygenase-like lactoylglutathione lyase family enzyme